jgi:HSP20 family protein
MSLVRWSPFFEPFEEFEKMLDLPTRASRAFVPAVDVYETKDAVMIESPLAGVDPNDVEITVDNNILTIKGETSKTSEVEEKDYYRKEVRSGSFYRQVALPSNVEGEKTEASFEKGMLKISIPKKEEIKAKAIKVNVKK